MVGPNMRGSITQRSKGSWCLKIDEPRDPLTGKRHQHTETVRGTRKDAERRLTELKHSLDKGTYVTPSRMSFGEYLRDWSRRVEPNLSPRTARSYRDLVRLYVSPELGAIPLYRLEPMHVQLLCDHLKARPGKGGGVALSPRTVRYCYTIVKKALNDAQKMGLVVRNVAAVVDPPPMDPKPSNPMAPEDVPTFLEFARDTPYYALLFTLVYTGMRRGEALALKWKNVDLVLCTLSVVESMYWLDGEYHVKKPKTKHGRRLVALPPSLALVLLKHKEEQESLRQALGTALTPEDFVFSHPDGKPWNPDTITHAFPKITARAGLPRVRLHDLRHTHATIMLKAGTPAKVVSERLGHSSTRITLDVYSHVLPGMQEAAARDFDDLIKGRAQAASVNKVLPSG